MFAKCEEGYIILHHDLHFWGTEINFFSGIILV